MHHAPVTTAAGRENMAAARYHLGQRLRSMIRAHSTGLEQKRNTGKERVRT